ncbi:hydrolase, P-loop-like family protein [Halobacteriovorax sp. BALOs_7]|uniref:ABC transporter ATP-binding protein n=1 Tax=Halobacteriovorax vibrionivorans TaxID=2152716 RepID=A0ABY0ID77_9BACT|nr:MULTISPECIES: ABC transporter ATP-binding protein [Halobacteriovorax]AYF44839.1 hydrolase, P-loop-like family protein [Halobacteriovorax sp. BALOs_7]RZF20916.1 ABC transporter ATP-binding protein [Halobacteriovorax vibrionivorans]TGD46016.1 ABC transporter ATP-binding protein [Halobacteriovorax sp. Y22]
MSVIDVRGVSKRYRDQLALSDFSLSVENGDVVALLGPNGAGKTTFVKCMLDLISADSGEITIFGKSSKDPRSRASLVYLPEKFNFYDYFTVKETLKFFAEFHGVEKSQVNGRIDEALKKLSIDKFEKKKLKELSKGQMQRVGLCIAVVANKELIILDEPFSGLDPIGIKDVKDICLELSQQGKTILINSHILSEVEKFATKVIILNNGQVKAQGPLNEVRGDISLEERFYDLVKNDSGSEHA